MSDAPDFFSLTRDALTDFQTYEEAEIPGIFWIEKRMKRLSRRLRVNRLFETLYDVTTNRAKKFEPEYKQYQQNGATVTKTLWEYRHEKDNITVTESRIDIAKPVMLGMIIQHRKQIDFNIQAPDQGYELHVRSSPHTALEVDELRPLSQAEVQKYFGAAPDGMRLRIPSGFVYK